MLKTLHDKVEWRGKVLGGPAQRRTTHVISPISAMPRYGKEKAGIGGRLHDLKLI